MIRKLLAVVVAVAAAVPASAGNLMLGPAKLSPSYGFKTSYEDNIYRVPRDINHTAVSGGGVRGSWIFDNALGLGMELPTAQGQKLNLDYGVTFENYTTQSKANNAINQTAGGAYSFEGSKTKAKAFDNYVNTHDPQFNPNGNVVNGSLVTREARWSNTAGANAEYNLGSKFFAAVDGSWSENRYLDRSGGATSLANLLNTSGGVFGAKAGYQVMPKTRVFTAVHESLTHYTERTRADNHRDTLVDFGAEGDFTAKLKGTVQAGYVYQGFDYDPANAGRKTVARNWTTSASLDWKPTETNQIVLTAVRANLDAATSGSRYYTSSGGNLAYNHKFGEKITAGVNGGVTYDKYSDDFVYGAGFKSRRDDTYQVGAKVDYQVYEWLKTGASFTNVDRYSTFSQQFNYRDNITAVNASVKF
ncbi:MAG: outer membrane beta-barrel protein [Elusimicrobiota bacterium]